MLARSPGIVATIAKPPATYRMTLAKRDALVDSTVDVMRAGEPTPFALEGVCRHALRSCLCLGGWRWHRADLAAADIVGAALRRLGAARPTWLDGQGVAFQDGAGVPRERCLGCGRRLLGAVGEVFCSRPCKGVWRLKMAAQFEAQRERAAHDVGLA